MKPKIFWWVLLWCAGWFVVLLPFLALACLGVLWLRGTPYLVYYLAGSIAVILAGVLIKKCAEAPILRHLTVSSPSPAAAAPIAAELRKEIALIADRTENISLDNAEQVQEEIKNVLLEILQTVARRYRPDSDEAHLEVPVSHTLGIAELVARDLRRMFSDKIPWGPKITVKGVLKMSERTRQVRFTSTVLSQLIRSGYWATAVVSPATLPNAIAAEVRKRIFGEGTKASLATAKRSLIRLCVTRAGDYAIQLYSGQLILEEADYDKTMEKTVRHLERAELEQGLFRNEPFNVLVAGQKKAGKSSLVNALLGEMRAPVDVVPRTRDLDLYPVDRIELPTAILRDTPGYHEEQSLAEMDPAVHESDLILLACSARSAARKLDRAFLDRIRDYYQLNPDRMMPPVLVVLTNIDHVPPVRQWDPPYDLAEPNCRKSRSIRDASLAVAEDLGVAGESVVPAYLVWDSLYGVDEGVIPAMWRVLPEAARLKDMRCIRSIREEKDGTRFAGEVKKGAKSLVEGWATLAKQMASRVWDAGSDRDSGRK